MLVAAVVKVAVTSRRELDGGHLKVVARALEPDGSDDSVHSGLIRGGIRDIPKEDRLR